MFAPFLLADRFTGGTGNIALAFGYNPGSQIITEGRDNDAYAYRGDYNVTRPYAANGLNQYTTAGPASFTYDMNGNLTSDGSVTYSYDIENRIIGASGAKNATLKYDPMGRLYEVSNAAGSTRFLYDGDALVAEYDATSGALNRRYIHGSGVDEPLVWYEGATLTDPRYLHANHQGSIIAIANANSQVVGTLAYDPYGIPSTTPGSANFGRFQYTGQIWIPELGVYHYKARAYSPTLGRFLQTDPIGYDDQVNLYAYVANDPVNKTDPDGMHESHWLLRLLVPGQVAWDNAVTAAENGNWGSAVGHAATMVAEQVITVATLGEGGVAIQSSRAAVAAKAEQRTFQTYTKTNPATGERYAGKTSGTGTPAQNVARRDSAGYPSKDYGPARLDKSSTNPQAIRGREQQLIEKNGGAQSQGGNSGNRINGISDRNPNGAACRAAANKEFGPC